MYILGIAGTGSISKSTMGVFNSFVYATKELMPTIFIISIVTAMSNTLVASGINDEIVSPFKGVIKNYWVAYWVIGIVMMILSWFFWPSPSSTCRSVIFTYCYKSRSTSHGGCNFNELVWTWHSTF